MSLGWVLLGLVGWAFGLVVVLALFRMSGDQDRAARHAEKRLDPLPAPKVQRAEVIDELYAAVVNGQAPLHNGAWAMATMEACFAILQSAKEQREIALAHQTTIGR